MYRLDEGSGTSKLPAFSSVTPALAPASANKHFLSKRELAAVLGVSARTIENWVAEKRIPRLRLSSRLTRFNLSKVLNALARYEIKEVGARR